MREARGGHRNVGSVIPDRRFKLFQEDGKGRPVDGLKVDDLLSGVMIVMDCSEMTSGLEAARYL
jgi:hypothetical protein